MSDTLVEPKIDEKLIADHGITPEEYKTIQKILGRDPNFTELGIFSVMWSEHCSYKNSRPCLKLFPTTGPKVLVKAGDENAGAIDIGDNLALVFKMESHNHPSAIEPFQGAATGLGGILRDIFTMGSRPILNLNSLRFGSLEKGTNRHLLKGVVEGVAHYGNCIGIPTIGGEIYFDEFYEGNPLVNVLSLGILTHNEIKKGKASGVGNPVYYVGSSTGRDGLGGASFASRELTEESKEDRPAVQVGDPFLEKLLLEACLELYKTDAIVGIQDMGAAGLTCSTCETAARGDAGIAIEINKVPQRESGMIPYEVLLSESQERMLIIVKKGKEKIVEDIFEKWDLHAEHVGEVIEGNKMQVFHNDKLVADIPAKALTDEGPVYIREEKEPEYLKKTRAFKLESIQDLKDGQEAKEVLFTLLDSPTIASKEWIYHQYDHMVRTDTTFYPGSDAAVVRVKDTKKGIAMSTDCNGLYCYLDPYEGGKIAVAEAARNVACCGAKPLAVTDCLNFGNPMKPEVFWTFKKSIEGLRDACVKFDTPVTGGNVSFYNESPKGAIYPTPSVGVAGLIDDIDNLVPSHFQKEGDEIFLIGDTRDELGGSQYLLIRFKKREGLPPSLDLDIEYRLQQFLQKGSASKVFQSAHDLSEGGIIIGLAESLFAKRDQPLGCSIDLSNLLGSVRLDSLLFGESQSRVIISINPEQKSALEALAKEFDLPLHSLGLVGGTSLNVKDLFDVPSVEIEKIYREAIGNRMKV
jgi:phosphoribosylformylglycinamidine synthase II